VEIHTRNAAQFEGKMPALVTTLKAARRWLVVAPRAQRFVIVRGRTPIGMISLSNIDGLPLDNATIGYWLDHEYTGQGYAREAASRILFHAFHTLHLHRVEANIEPSNRRSIRVVKSLGFRAEGTRKRYLHLGGRWRDQRCFALLADEWKA
jgi:RimJ/RimL family protein N-acetyltransferase